MSIGLQAWTSHRVTTPNDPDDDPVHVFVFATDAEASAFASGVDWVNDGALEVLNVEGNKVYVSDEDAEVDD